MPLIVIVTGRKTVTGAAQGIVLAEMLGGLVSRTGSVNKSPRDLEPATLLKVELDDLGLF